MLVTPDLNYMASFRKDVPKQMIRVGNMRASKSDGCEDAIRLT